MFSPSSSEKELLQLRFAGNSLEPYILLIFENLYEEHG